MKQNKNKIKKIIILTKYTYPCYHPVMENVFAKEIGKKLDVLFLLKGNFPIRKKYKWHNSYVILSKINSTCKISSILNKLFDYKNIYNLVKILFQQKIDYILVRDLPLESFLIYFLKPIFGFKLYFQTSAPSGDLNIAYHNNQQKKRRALWYLFRGAHYNFFIKRALKTADMVFPITIFHKEKLNTTVKNKKMHPLTMGVDIEWINRQKKKINELEILKKNNYLVTYFGTLIFNRNPKMILKIFYEVKKKIKNCKLLLMGNASSWEIKELKKECIALDIIDDVIFTGQLDRNTMQDYLAYCDISLCIIPPEEHFKISSPTKLYESLGNEVPVIANREIYEVEKVIKNSGGGIITDYDEMSIASKIILLLKKNRLRKNMGEKGKKYILDFYSYQSIAKNIGEYFI